MVVTNQRFKLTLKPDINLIARFHTIRMLLYTRHIEHWNVTLSSRWLLTTGKGTKQVTVCMCDKQEHGKNITWPYLRCLAIRRMADESACTRCDGAAAARRTTINYFVAVAFKNVY